MSAVSLIAGSGVGVRLKVGINIEQSEWVGSGRGCVLPSWGSGGLLPEKKIALKIMQFLASFGTSFLYYSIKWGIIPQS